ncbi:MAG: tRNA epoxyqueuosine(34) reductase QueG [Bryobacterales bacterium]|nr:tRNA epoxyqueuosine(34) reductase QueG [Bryobacteraceae bacterium]MDW8131442.1 tRNA epoxyqueuosine(34) reductase QueG [Bryobacterales bacterium]
MDTQRVLRLARECGFELAGVARAEPLAEFAFYRTWVAAGMAGEMRYLADHRASLRADPRALLPQARSVICVGKVYHTSAPGTHGTADGGRGWISRYAWGEDYHVIVRAGLRRLLEKLREAIRADFVARVLVDAAPLLERALARRAGLGWIGRNTCLINQRTGSWVFLGELLVSLELEPGQPAPDRCGSCMRCVEACPTGALVPTGLPDDPAWTLDARRCISYLTIELRGTIPEELRSQMGRHVFGCDICQEVCPWNRKAPVTAEAGFQPREYAPGLAELASLDRGQFARRFARSPVRRAGYEGLMRNVAVAMGNSARPDWREPLERLASTASPIVAEHARWALARLPERAG